MCNITTGCRDNIIPEDDVEYINTQNISVEDTYSLDGKTYELNAALCYETIDSMVACASDKKMVGGYYSVIRCEGTSKWIKYSTKSFVTPDGIKELKDKYVALMKDLEMKDPRKDEIYTDCDFTKTPASCIKRNLLDRELESEFTDKFNSGYIDARLLMIDNDEAMSMVCTNGCLLIYNEDYSVYESNLYSGRFFT